MKKKKNRTPDVVSGGNVWNAYYRGTILCGSSIDEAVAAVAVVVVVGHSAHIRETYSS